MKEESDERIYDRMLLTRTICSSISLICSFTIVILYFVGKIKNMNWNKSDDDDSIKQSKETIDIYNSIQEDDSNFEIDQHQHEGLATHFLIVLLFILMGNYILMIIFHAKRDYFKNNNNSCIVQSIFYHIFMLSSCFCITTISLIYYRTSILNAKNKFKRKYNIIIGYLFIFVIPILFSLLPLTTGSHSYTKLLCKINTLFIKDEVKEQQYKKNLAWTIIHHIFCLFNSIYCLYIIVKVKRWFKYTFNKDIFKNIIKNDFQLKSSKFILNLLLIITSTIFIDIISNEIMFLLIKRNQKEINKTPIFIIIFACISTAFNSLIGTFISIIIFLLIKDSIFSKEHFKKGDDECDLNNNLTMEIDQLTS